MELGCGAGLDNNPGKPEQHHAACTRALTKVLTGGPSGTVRRKEGHG
jgi:hypothetical protein